MNKSSRSFIFLIAMSLLCFSSAHAEPEVLVRTETYQVEGNTIEELSEAMRRNAPHQLAGHFASTKWNVIWNFDAIPGSAGCSIKRSNVKLDVVFYLPEWRGAADGDKKTRKKWERFMKKLQRHEDGHRNIGIEAARKIEKILKHSGTFQSCKEVNGSVNSAAQAVMAEKQAEEVQYDARTQHGLRQGARLKYTKPKPEAVSGEASQS